MQRIATSLAISVGALLAAAAAQAAEPQRCVLAKAAEFPVTMSGLKALIPVEINGQKLQMVVDSGAFFSSLTDTATAKLGLRPETLSYIRVRGLGGEADARRASVESVVLGSIRLSRSDFLVDRAEIAPGAAGIIGQNLIGVTDVEYDFANGVVRMFIPQGAACRTAGRPYWSQSYGVIDVEETTPAEPHIIGRVKVNGVQMRAMFDTGGGASTMTLRAAAKVGVTPQSAGVVPAYVVGGLAGDRRIQTWFAPFDTFAAGEETISKTRMQIGDLGLAGTADMLIGADFFLSHRVYYAKSQRKLYFTYNGGPVFRLEQRNAMPNPPPQQAKASEAAPAQPSAAQAVLAGRENAPTDAGGFVRRASASMSRRDFAGAIADYGKAAELDPGSAEPLVGRARAYLANRQPILAMGDLADALKLKPDDAEARFMRGALYLSQREQDRARADFDAVMKAAPDDALLPLRIAGVYQGQQLFQPALSYLDGWIARFPKGRQRPEALNMRCWVRAELGQDLEKALDDCNAALKLRPREASFLDSRGLVELRMGRFDQAVADYDVTLAQRPKEAWILYARGLAKIRKGMKAEGEADMAAAVVLEPKVSERAKTIGLAP